VAFETGLLLTDKPKALPLNVSLNRKEILMKKMLAIACIAAVLWTASPAFAWEWITGEAGHHLNQVETELHTILGIGEPGGGFRVGIPLWNNSFISTINDNVAVNFGIDVLKWPKPDFGGLGVAVPVMLQWNFYLTRDWSVFAEGGVALQNWSDRRVAGDFRTFLVSPGAGVGTRYYLIPDNYPALVLRIGYPSGISIGASF
jgi:hypothetical protein